MLGYAALLAALLALLLPWLLRGANELFALEVRDGRITRVRGRIPQGLLSAVEDIVARPASSRAHVRAVVEDRRPRLITRGTLTASQEQQLRNVLGLWTLGQLRTAPPRRGGVRS